MEFTYQTTNLKYELIKFTIRYYLMDLLTRLVIHNRLQFYTSVLTRLSTVLPLKYNQTDIESKTS